MASQAEVNEAQAADDVEREAVQADRHAAAQVHMSAILSDAATAVAGLTDAHSVVRDRGEANIADTLTAAVLLAAKGRDYTDVGGGPQG